MNRAWAQTFQVSLEYFLQMSVRERPLVRRIKQERGKQSKPSTDR